MGFLLPIYKALSNGPIKDVVRLVPDLLLGIGAGGQAAGRRGCAAACHDALDAAGGSDSPAVARGHIRSDELQRDVAWACRGCGHLSAGHA